MINKFTITIKEENCDEQFEPFEERKCEMVTMTPDDERLPISKEVLIERFKTLLESFWLKRDFIEFRPKEKGLTLKDIDNLIKILQEIKKS